MDLIVNHQRIRISSLFIRTISNYLPNTCIKSSRCISSANRLLQNIHIGDPIGSEKFTRNRLLTNSIFINQKVINHGLCKNEFKPRVCKYSTENSNKSKIESCETKPTLFQKMKQMTKDYWHILIPVHVATSIVWLSICYIAAKNGVNFEEIFKYFNLNESYLEKVRNSSAGHWAVAYALFKLCTPLRYTVTIGGTTMTIRYFNKWGIMKFKTPEKMKDLLSSKTVAQTKARFGKSDEKTRTTADSPKT